MRESNFEGPTPTDRKAVSCRCSAPEPDGSDDAELKRLFHDLALTLFRLMEQDDADILARSELRGQSLSEIASETGCSRAEATRRLNHAQRCFCKLVILTLVPGKPE